MLPKGEAVARRPSHNGGIGLRPGPGEHRALPGEGHCPAGLGVCSAEVAAAPGQRVALPAVHAEERVLAVRHEAEAAAEAVRIGAHLQDQSSRNQIDGCRSTGPRAGTHSQA